MAALRGLERGSSVRLRGAFAIPIIPKAISRGFGQPFQLVLQSQDLSELARFSSQFTGELYGLGLLQNIRPTFQLNKPQLNVHIDRDRAAALGVSVEEISRSLQILFGGEDLSSLTIKGEEYDVIVQLDRERRLVPSDLERLYLRNDEGDLVQLSNVASYTPGAGPNAIFHYNRLRSATIEASPVGVPLGTAMAQVEEKLRGVIPPGFRYTWSGEARDLKDAGKDTLFVVGLALVVIYMVLAAQFESLLHPFTVMLSVPLAVLGAFGGLWMLNKVNILGTGLYGWANYAPDPPAIAGVLSAVVPRIPAMNINVFSQIGVILLLGLVTKNAILLVDFANQRVAQGMSALEAMRAAGRTRFRPILMTAFATISGILPIALGTGAGAEGRRPMGITVVGGMLTSTFLTLFVVPVVYVLLHKLPQRFAGTKEVEVGDG